MIGSFKLKVARHQDPDGFKASMTWSICIACKHVLGINYGHFETIRYL